MRALLLFVTGLANLFGGQQKVEKHDEKKRDVDVD